VTGDNFLTQPPLDRGVTFQQCAYTVAHHFADRRVSARLNLALHDLGHVERQRDAELLCGPHTHLSFAAFYHK
jgi:hypothetical protein